MAMKKTTSPPDLMTVIDDENAVQKASVVGESKLLVGDKVEIRGGGFGALFSGNCKSVRFSNNRWEGCWKSGVVFGCYDGLCLVEYDTDSRADADAKKIIRPVAVGLSPAIQIGLPNETPTKIYRTNIRPAPPHYEVDIDRITHGMCVDVLINNTCWEEGVVFDAQDDSSTRSIFFPDHGGDIPAVDTTKMRVSFEWSNDSGLWNLKGRWIFLEVMKEFLDDMKNSQLPVSVKQIWDDVSRTETYKTDIGCWTYGPKHIWKALIWEAIREAISISNGEKECVISPVAGKRQLLDDIQMRGSGTLISTMKQERKRKYSGGCEGKQWKKVKSGDERAIRSKVMDHISAMGWKIYRSVQNRGKLGTTYTRYKYLAPDGKVFLSPKKTNETIADVDIGPVNYPEAILDYISCVESENVLETLTHVFKEKRKMAKCHLVHSGWKLHRVNEDCDIIYCSPDYDNSFNSLFTACKAYLRLTKQS